MPLHSSSFLSVTTEPVEILAYPFEGDLTPASLPLGFAVLVRTEGVCNTNTVASVSCYLEDHLERHYGSLHAFANSLAASFDRSSCEGSSLTIQQLLLGLERRG